MNISFSRGVWDQEISISVPFSRVLHELELLDWGISRKPLQTAFLMSVGRQRLKDVFISQVLDQSLSHLGFPQIFHYVMCNSSAHEGEQEELCLMLTLWACSRQEGVRLRKPSTTDMLDIALKLCGNTSLGVFHHNISSV